MNRREYKGMGYVITVIAFALCVGALAYAGAYTIKEGINQAIEFNENLGKEKENQDNAEL